MGQGPQLVRGRGHRGAGHGSTVRLQRDLCKRLFAVLPGLRGTTGSQAPGRVEPCRSRSRSSTAPPTTSPRRSTSGPTSSGCARRRTAGPRSRPTPSTSRRARTSSTGSRTRSATGWPAWSSRRRSKTLEITVGLVADLMVINPFDFFVEEYAEHFPFAYEPGLPADLSPYLRPVDDAVAADEFRRSMPQPVDQPGGVPTVQFLADLNAAVNRDVAYSVRMEAGVQTPDETLRRRIGSCRDSAWLLVACCASTASPPASSPATSCSSPPTRRRLDGPSGPREDFTDLHAWAEVYVPGAGWVGMDPTSSLFAGEGHIPLSATPAPEQRRADRGRHRPRRGHLLLPQRGTPRPRGPAGHQALHRRAVGPRSTRSARPSTPAGRRRRPADDGRRADVRLPRRRHHRRSGTPTPTAPRSARSPTTSPSGSARRTPPAGSCTAARASGTRASRSRAGTSPSSGAPTASRSGRTRRSSPTRGPRRRRPGRRAAQPTPRSCSPGGSPGCSACPPSSCSAPTRTRSPRSPTRSASPRASRPTRRHRRPEHVAELDVAADTPTGWVLPLVTGEEWTSPAWRFRRGRLVLTPGTSAVGLRLPLDAIAWDDPAYAGEPSYLEAGPPLEPSVPTVTVADPDEAPTTALAFEARDGHVHVFLPPTERLEDYADLLKLVEVAVRRLRDRLPGGVVLEGYGPPPDPRLTQLVVTPDPGVIEVNVQPTSSWAEQRDLLTDAVRRGAAVAADHREVRPRRAAHRHRRRQPPHARRASADRLPAAAPPRPAGQPDHLLAAAPEPVLPVLGPLHRPDQPGPALRRGPAGGDVRDGDRLRRDRPADRASRTRTASSRARGWSTGRCGTCSPT